MKSVHICFSLSHIFLFIRYNCPKVNPRIRIPRSSYRFLKTSVMRKLQCLVYLLFLFTSYLCDKPPHIIFIIIDDLGWNDVSFHGSKQIPTPNIDTLAKDGVILNNYYVQPICTPSRGALMTGKYPIRLGLQHDVIYAEAPWGLSPKEKILPQYLKELGYTTRGVGKWHLGYFHESYLPVNRGFDSFFGYWNGKEDFYTHFEEGQGTNGLDFHEDNENAWNYTGLYSTNVFTDRAKKIIANHNTSKPLFLYLAHQAVHAGNSYTPLQAPPEYVQRFPHIKDHERKIFAGMVSNLDDCIGELFSALNSSGMLRDSVIIFTTDNGAAVQGIDQSTGSNWPLRGSKYNMWEGGVRGVAFVWSDKIRNAPQKVSSQMMHMSDWLPTIHSIAGGNLNALDETDGYNLWPSICCGIPSPRFVILHNIDSSWKVEAIRMNQFKLLKGSVLNGEFDGWFDQEGKKKMSFFTDSDLQLHDEVYMKLFNKCQVLAILSNTYGPAFKSPSNSVSQIKNAESPLTINCGERPKNESSKCDPLKAACLFDISKDPCEYNNLVTTFPEVVEELENILNKYRVLAVPIRNKPLDPLSNPKYHGYAWIPWRTTDISV